MKSEGECVSVCVRMCVYSLSYFSLLKQKKSQRTVFWNTKIFKKVPGTARDYNLTPWFRYYPINACKAAINLVSNSRLPAVLPKCRGNDWAESSYTVCKGSIKDLLRPVHYSTSLRRFSGCPDHFPIIGHLLQSFLITPEYGSTQATFEAVRGVWSIELRSWKLECLTSVLTMTTIPSADFSWPSHGCWH